MIPDRLITADARAVSGLEFFDAVFGSSPEKRAKRAEEGRKIAADMAAKNRREILDMRERIAAMVSPERAAGMRAEWALQDRAAEIDAHGLKVADRDLRATLDMQVRKRA